MRSYGSLSGHAQKVVFLIYVSLIPMVLTLGNESLLMMFLPGTSESGLTFEDFSHQEVLDFLVLIYSFII